MKAFLMHRDEDFDLSQHLPQNEQALTQDLELTTLLAAMARGDQFLLNVARVGLLCSLDDPEGIAYRQHIVSDCLAQPDVVREIYDIAVETIVEEKKIYRGFFRRPDSILNGSVSELELFVGKLRKLRQLADEHGHKFRSEGFTRFFAMLTAELDDDYFGVVTDHLKRLRFRAGALISATLGDGNKGTDYVLREPREVKLGLVDRIIGKGPASYTLTISDRDESGAQALSELRDRGINLVANALAQATDHILSFFSLLRSEMAFYVGCLNLYEALSAKSVAVCFPKPLPVEKCALSSGGLYDPCLSLTTPEPVVGNDLNADDRSLVVITGANTGGKSTFLRSLGLGQLMMQAGMFVAANSFSANVCSGIFTHYKREEDTSMTSGKLDEELSRMREIADKIAPRSILLCNESFAATNEREGSEIGRQVVRALVDTDIKVFFVTHLYDLAESLYREQREAGVFLRAERKAGGRRTFKLVEGAPLPTSYGADLYTQVFGTGAGSARSDTRPAHTTRPIARPGERQ